MRRAPFSLLCTVSALLLSTAVVRAQAKTTQPEERGWSDSWRMPANDEQRHLRELVSRCDALQKAKNWQGIVEACNAELRRQPGSFPVHIIRAYAYVGLKKYDLATADTDRAKEIADQKNAPAARIAVFSLCSSLNKLQGKYRAAADDLRAILKIDRTNGEALNDLAWLLAVAPDDSLRNGREAIGLAKKALAARPSDQSYGVKDTLAAAYAENNDYGRAVDLQAVALEEAPKKVKDAARLAEFQRGANERLHLYQQHQPYRLKGQL